MLGSVFGRADFSRILCLGRRIFSRILSLDFFSSFLWEKVPRKILQENPRQNPPNLHNKNPPTHFCRLARAINDGLGRNGRILWEGCG